MLEWFIVYSQ